jgi:hypothetical protein
MASNMRRTTWIWMVGVFAILAVLLAPVTHAQATFNRAISWAATGHLVFSDTAPTVASGFGTTPTIVASNGAVAFRVGVGTGGAASAGVITMPTATTGWVCHVDNLTARAGNVADARTVQTATGTTSITVQNQTISTGAALAWTASDNLLLLCAAY